MKRIALLVVAAACNPWWPCPDRPPANGQSCVIRDGRIGDWCEYFGDDHGQCITTADCALAPNSTTSEIWYVHQPEATCGVNAATCPAAFGDMEGASCAPTMPECEYSAGKCGCIACQNGNAGGGAMWHCRPWSDAGTGCPLARPHAGEGCDTEGVYCNYGDCCNGPSFGGDLVCKGGAWQPMVNSGCICVLPKCP